MKNNGLRGLVALLAVIFVGNLFSMKMTERGKEHGKVYAQKVMVQRKQQEQQQKELKQEREKQFQTGKYFVYEQGTSKGILVDQKLLDENSDMVKSMVEDFGGKLQEISFPFPIDDIKLFFLAMNKKVNLEKLSLQQLSNLMKVEEYLLLPLKDTATYKSIAVYYSKALNNASLEQLVSLYNSYNIEGSFVDNDEQKKIFEKIVDIINNIDKVIDLKNFAYRLGFIYDSKHVAQCSEKIRKLFINYSGKMIPILPGSKDMIPDYNVLNNLVRQSKSFYLPSPSRYVNSFIDQPIIEFISSQLKGLQINYEAYTSWIDRKLGIISP